MGVSTSPQQLARKVDGFARDLGDTRLALNATGLAVKKIMEGTAASAGALGATPSGKRKGIGVRYDVRGGTRGSGAVIVAYTGPAHLLNNPTSPHFIAPAGFGSRAALSEVGRGIGAVTAFGGSARGMLGSPGQRGRGRRRRGGKRALTIGDNVRAYAFHPGTSGKRFFQAAKPVAAQTAPRVYARAGLTEPLRRNFR
ncbi:MAG: hypothetical protein ACODAF_08710 [Actinomycetota bacterium]